MIWGSGGDFKVFVDGLFRVRVYFFFRFKLLKLLFLFIRFFLGVEFVGGSVGGW